jgi:hypothetical protein
MITLVLTMTLAAEAVDAPGPLEKAIRAGAFERALTLAVDPQVSRCPDGRVGKACFLESLRLEVESALSVEAKPGSASGRQPSAPVLDPVEPVKRGQRAFVAASTLTLRKRPSVDAEALGSLPIGAELTVRALSEGWARVDLERPLAGRQGWVWPLIAQAGGRGDHDGGQPHAQAIVELGASVRQGFVRAEFLDAAPLDETALLGRAASFEAQGAFDRALVVRERLARLTRRPADHRSWLLAAWEAHDASATARALLAAAGKDTIAGFAVERIEVVTACNGPPLRSRVISVGAPPRTPLTCLTFEAPCGPSGYEDPGASAEDRRREAAEAASELRAYQEAMQAGRYTALRALRLWLRNPGVQPIEAGTPLLVFVALDDGPAMESGTAIVELTTPAKVLPGQSVDAIIEARLFGGLHGQVGLTRSRPLESECPGFQADGTLQQACSHRPRLGDARLLQRGLACAAD